MTVKRHSGFWLCEVVNVECRREICPKILAEIWLNVQDFSCTFMSVLFLATFLKVLLQHISAKGRKAKNRVSNFITSIVAYIRNIKSRQCVTCIGEISDVLWCKKSTNDIYRMIYYDPICIVVLETYCISSYFTFHYFNIRLDYIF